MNYYMLKNILDIPQYAVIDVVKFDKGVRLSKCDIKYKEKVYTVPTSSIISKHEIMTNKRAAFMEHSKWCAIFDNTVGREDDENEANTTS